VGGGQPTPGMVLDRSRGGLRLSVAYPVTVGRILGLRTESFPKDLPTVQVRVRHCQKKGEQWKLGCQFIEKLPWTVVLLFG